MPNFADGYDLDGGDGPDDEDPSAALTPVRIELDPQVDLDKAKLRLSYAASDPAEVDRTGGGTPADPYVFTLPAAGGRGQAPEPLRLWTDVSGFLVPPRTNRPVTARGLNDTADQNLSFYVPPSTGDGYTGDDLRRLGFSGQNRVVTLWVEGVAPTTTGAGRAIHVELTRGDTTPGGPPAADDQDTVLVTVPTLDLDVDSDNTSQPGADPVNGREAGLPARTADQERIEDDPSKTGKVLIVNDGDKDADGVPDFADGHDLDQGDSDDDANDQERFVPLVLEVPKGSDPAKPDVAFDYTGSDPRAVVAPSTDRPDAGYAPASGNLRLWRRVGSSQDVPTAAGARTADDYLVPNRRYRLNELPGYDADTSTVTLYVEAVRPSDRAGDDGHRVVARLYQVNAYSSVFASGGDPHRHGNGMPAPLGSVAEDAVRLTALQDAPMYYGDASNVLGGAAGGSTGGDPMADAYSGAVRLSDGRVGLPATTDLSSGGFGQPWGVTRTWTTQVGFGLKGQVGNGWIISEMPYLIQATTGVVQVVSGRAARFFDYVVDGQGNPSYKARFFGQDTLSYDKQSNTYVLTDTLGNQTIYNGFGNGPAAAQGAFQKFVDAGGNETAVTLVSGTGLALKIERSGDGVTETWQYDYWPRDPNKPDAPDRLKKVTLSRAGGTHPGTAQTAQYDYYDGTGGTGSRGGDGDLKFVTIKDLTANPAGVVVDQMYYVYATDPSAPAKPAPLAVVLGTAAIARLNGDLNKSPDQATRVEVEKYADLILGYGNGGAVTAQQVSGAGPSSPTAKQALGTYTYQYLRFGGLPEPAGSVPPSGGIGTNVWSDATVVTPPSVRLTNLPNQTVYTNYAGEVMLTTTSADGKQYHAFTEYDGDGRAVLDAMPSAVVGVDPNKPDLLGARGDHTNPANHDFELLRDADGLINVTEYYRPGGPGPAGYAKQASVLHGDTATAVVLSESSYGSQPATLNGVAVTIHPVTKTTVHQKAGDGGQFTSFNYDYPTGKLIPKSITTLLPVVGTSQNGRGTADSSVSYLDRYGRVQWEKNPTGAAAYTGYDAGTGAVVASIADASKSQAGTPLANGHVVAAWPDNNWNRTGLGIKVLAAVDAFGRTTQFTDGRGNVTTTACSESLDADTVSASPPTGPLQFTRVDRASGFVAHYTTDRTNTSNLQSLARDYVDYSGRVVYSDQYYHFLGANINPTAATAPGTATTPPGQLSGNYYETQYFYGPLGRETRVKNAVGTDTVTTYDDLGRPIALAVWPRGNSLTLIASYKYDDPAFNGGVGDGNLTEVTRYPGTGSPRVTRLYYDWRDQNTGSKDWGRNNIPVQVTVGTAR